MKMANMCSVELQQMMTLLLKKKRTSIFELWTGFQLLGLCFSTCTAFS